MSRQYFIDWLSFSAKYGGKMNDLFKLCDQVDKHEQALARITVKAARGIKLTDAEKKLFIKNEGLKG